MNVLVIGGSGFIGGAIARELEVQGHKVFKTSLTEGRSGCARLDVMDIGSIEATTVAFESVGKLDAIVYAVGNCPKGGFMNEINKPLTVIDSSELRKNLELHVEGFLNVVQGLWPLLTDGGHIVVVSSAITRLNDAPAPPFLTVGHYAAAKAAQDALIGWLRKDQNILEKGIKIHRLAPPAVDSPFHVGTPEQFSPPALLPVGVISSAAVMALYMTHNYETDFSSFFK